MLIREKSTESTGLRTEPVLILFIRQWTLSLSGLGIAYRSADANEIRIICLVYTGCCVQEAGRTQRNDTGCMGMIYVTEVARSASKA